MNAHGKTAEHLKQFLQTAVPLFIIRFKDLPWEDLRQIMMESEKVLEESGELAVFTTVKKGETAKVFNAIAKAIAALSFVPGGIEIFGLHFETKHEGPMMGVQRSAVNMYSACKVFNANPRSLSFLGSTTFVYNHDTRKVAIIKLSMAAGILYGVKLTFCDEGPGSFQEVIEESDLQVKKSREGTVLVCREALPSIDVVEDFVVEDLRGRLEDADFMAAHEEVAELLRGCHT